MELDNTLRNVANRNPQLEVCKGDVCLAVVGSYDNSCYELCFKPQVV